jgi:hypothetical protein
MVTWEWTKQPVEPEDILDAAKAIPVTSDRIVMSLTGCWTSAGRLLEWACAALNRGTDDGWDTASSLAKRAVCRQMDGILAHNHLGCFHGENYKKKAGYLAALKMPGLTLLRDLVIDPRNDIEHAYEVATEDQARQACEVAELFLGATEKEAQIPAILALGWNVSSSESISTAPGQEFHRIEIKLTKEHEPMLFIKGYPSEPEVLVIYPKEETVSTCPLKKFKPEQVMTLNARLRECLKSDGFTQRSLSPAFVKAMKEQLKL